MLMLMYRCVNINTDVDVDADVNDDVDDDADVDDDIDVDNTYMSMSISFYFAHYINLQWRCYTSSKVIKESKSGFSQKSQKKFNLLSLF
jgi:hypothetical protein